MNLPDHLRKFVEDEAAKHLNSQMSNVKNECMREALRIDFIAGANALYLKLIEMSKDEEKAIDEESYRYSGSLSHSLSCWGCCDSDYDHERDFFCGARFGLLLNRVKGDGHE